jgi:CxxC-x17-CxxC domain-containing protein
VTIIIDDAGSGDLLFGVVIGAYRLETGEFTYELVGVKFYQPKLFREKTYLKETTRIATELLATLKLKPDEEIHLCQGNIFDDAAEELRKAHGEDRVKRIKVVGEPQRLIEIAYLDEIRNLGYEPLAEREEKRAKSFFHMMRWLKAHPAMLSYAKTGWPRLARYHLFKPFHSESLYTAVCSKCGSPCEVPFKPAPDRPVYCRKCWAKRRRRKKRAST